MKLIRDFISGLRAYFGKKSKIQTNISSEAGLVTQFGKNRRSSDTCVLCGERKATTKEHIPPKALFLEKPKEYLTVPACLECNNSTKLEDEYLLQAMAAGSLWGEGTDVWKNKVIPKLDNYKKTKAGLRNQTLVKDIIINSGQIIKMPVLNADKKRIEKSLRKLACGLYWWHTGSILRSDVEIQSLLLNPVNGPKYFDDPEMRSIFQSTNSGVYHDSETRKTFFYTWLISEDLCLFYFFFYRQNIFICAAQIEKTGH
jgi:hypothetical protein